jgi:hypothetical protein
LNGRGGQDAGSFVVFEAEQRPILPHTSQGEREGWGSV